MQAHKSLYLHILACFVNPVAAVWKDDNVHRDIMAAEHMPFVSRASDRSTIGCFQRKRTVSELSDG